MGRNLQTRPSHLCALWPLTPRADQWGLRGILLAHDWGCAWSLARGPGLAALSSPTIRTSRRVVRLGRGESAKLGYRRLVPLA
jgi:hypothetical protein